MTTIYPSDGRMHLMLANGRPVDLLNPRGSDIDFEAIAEHLAKIARFNGATPGVEYSVAQHTVIGARRILADYSWGPERETAARYFLLHDCHEAFLGDDTSPKKRALEAIATLKFGALAGAVMAAFGEITARFDKVIHQKAGLPWPPALVIAEIVKRTDRRMLITEWAAFMPGTLLPGADAADPPPFVGPMAPVAWEKARDELLDLFFTMLSGA